MEPLLEVFCFSGDEGTETVQGFEVASFHTQTQSGFKPQGVKEHSIQYANMPAARIAEVRTPG
jgi:hypothetical protein